MSWCPPSELLVCYMIWLYWTLVSFQLIYPLRRTIYSIAMFVYQRVVEIWSMIWLVFVQVTMPQMMTWGVGIKKNRGLRFLGFSDPPRFIRGQPHTWFGNRVLRYEHVWTFTSSIPCPKVLQHAGIHDFSTLDVTFLKHISSLHGLKHGHHGSWFPVIHRIRVVCQAPSLTMAACSTTSPVDASALDRGPGHLGAVAFGEQCDPENHPLW